MYFPCWNTDHIHTEYVTQVQLARDQHAHSTLIYSTLPIMKQFTEHFVDLLEKVYSHGISTSITDREDEDIEVGDEQLDEITSNAGSEDS